jgi:hypothetical protein
VRVFFGLLVLISCVPVDEGEPDTPTGRLRPGLERCSSVFECSIGACFISAFDDGRYCTGANDRSACDVITCDAPARCVCVVSNPPQCGCSF